MYTILKSFKRSIIPGHIQYSYIYTWRNSPLLPLLVPFCSPFVSPSTYLAPSSCDRNRPPPSQVACKLTLFAPPFTQLPHPFQIPRTPTAQRQTMTTSGIFWLLLSGTLTINCKPSQTDFVKAVKYPFETGNLCNRIIVKVSLFKLCKLLSEKWNLLLKP